MTCCDCLLAFRHFETTGNWWVCVSLISVLPKISLCQQTRPNCPTRPASLHKSVQSLQLVALCQSRCWCASLRPEHSIDSLLCLPDSIQCASFPAAVFVTYVMLLTSLRWFRHESHTKYPLVLNFHQLSPSVRYRPGPYHHGLHFQDPVGQDLPLHQKNLQIQI